MNNLSKSHSPPDKKLSRKNDPEVIIDFVFDRGLFYISIKNIAEKPVYRVSVKFDKKLFGIEGTKEISALPLFKNIEFMPPNKEITTFLDTSASYFNGKNPTLISAEIKYIDSYGKRNSHTIKHDLKIYREIGYINLGK